MIAIDANQSVAKFDFVTPNKDTIWYASEAANVFETPYEISVTDLADIKGDYSLNLYADGWFRNTPIASQIITAKHVKSTNGVIKGKMKIPGSRLYDGKFKLVLTKSKRRWYHSSKVAESKSFKLVRLLGQPLRSKSLKMVDNIEFDFNAREMGAENGLSLKVLLNAVPNKHKLSFHLIHADTGKRAGISAKLGKKKRDSVITMNLPKDDGKYYVEVIAHRAFRSNVVIYRSQLVEINSSALQNIKTVSPVDEEFDELTGVNTLPSQNLKTWSQVAQQGVHYRPYERVRFARHPKPVIRAEEKNVYAGQDHGGVEEEDDGVLPDGEQPDLDEEEEEDDDINDPFSAETGKQRYDDEWVNSYGQYRRAPAQFAY